MLLLFWKKTKQNPSVFFYSFSLSQLYFFLFFFSPVVASSLIEHLKSQQKVRVSGSQQAESKVAPDMRCSTILWLGVDWGKDDNVLMNSQYIITSGDEKGYEE
jgi:hypothetical protein